MADKLYGDVFVLGALSARRLNRGLEQVSTSQTLEFRSASEYVFVGQAASQTVTVPVSGLVAGWSVLVENLGSESVVVQIDGSNPLGTVAAGQRKEFVAKIASPAAVANWIVRAIDTDAQYISYDATGNTYITSGNVQDALDDVESSLGDLAGDISANAGDISTINGDISDLLLAIGIADGDQDLGDFATNVFLTDNTSVKAALEAIDTAAIRKDGTVAFTGDVSLGGFKVTNLGVPVADSDAATKIYVDNAISAVVSGTEWQDSVRGDSDGINFADAAAAVAGITSPVVGDRVLGTDGIYELTDVGSGSEAWSLLASAEKGFAASLDDEQNAVALFTGAAWTIVRWERTNVSGTGLSMDTDGVISLDSGIAGSGITFNGGELHITVGNGLEIDGSEIIQVVLDGTTLSNSASGLKVNIADFSLEESSGLKVKLDGAGAIGLDSGDAGLEVLVDGTSIEIDNNALRIASGAAGDGLGYLSGVLSVNVGNGIAISADTVVIDLAASESGLEFNGGKLQVQRDYELAFNDSTDWGSAAGGYYTISVAVATHAQGAQPIVHIYELEGSDFVEVSVDQVKIAADGSVSFRVPEVPSGLFAGKVKISHSYLAA